MTLRIYNGARRIFFVPVDRQAIRSRQNVLEGVDAVRSRGNVLERNNVLATGNPAGKIYGDFPGQRVYSGKAKLDRISPGCDQSKADSRDIVVYDRDRDRPVRYCDARKVSGNFVSYCGDDIIPGDDVRNSVVTSFIRHCVTERTS